MTSQHTALDQPTATKRTPLTETAPVVSVILPVLNESRHIDRVLQLLVEQDFDDMEVIVADGGSTDDTRERILHWMDRDERIRLIDNPGRIQATGLNELLEAARGHYMVRIDGHSFVDRHYVGACYRLLRSSGAGVVGGQMVAEPAKGVVACGIALANGARWGAGPAQFHRDGDSGEVETVYLGAFDTELVRSLGGWSTDLVANEDYELNHRIRAAGRAVWFDPSLRVGYQPRTTFRSLTRQYFNYGRGKYTVARRYPSSVKLRQVLPAILLPGLVACLVPWPLRLVARCGIGLHGSIIVAGSAASKANLPTRAAAAGAAMIMHWSWTAGFWYGAIRRVPGR